MTAERSTFPICAIVAMDGERAIGKDNTLPWRIPEDMKRFAQLTTGDTVLMGRKTYESLPEKFRPLPKRRNIVVSRTPEQLDLPEDVLVFNSPELAVTTLRERPELMQGGRLWIIGGGEIYKQTMNLLDEIFLTVVSGSHEGDVFLPEFEQDFVMTEREDHSGFSYLHYRRR